MADYRNIPLKFFLGGLDLTVSPENIGEGRGTRMLNVRPTRELLLEARRGTGTFEYPHQKLLGTASPIPHSGT